MKVVAVNGSPRKDGNTKLMLDKVLETMEGAGWKTELVQLGGEKIHGCRACFKCFEKKNKRCAFNDDVFNDCLAKLWDAQAMVLGSPTYFTDVSAEIKALIDRAGLVSLANGSAFAGKIGAAVVAVRRGGATHVYDSINHMYLMSQMIVPGSTYWNMAFGLGPGEAANDAEGMNNMRHLGLAIDWLGKAIHQAKDPYPVFENPEA